MDIPISANSATPAARHVLNQQKQAAPAVRNSTLDGSTLLPSDHAFAKMDITTLESFSARPAHRSARPA